MADGSAVTELCGLTAHGGLTRRCVRTLRTDACASLPSQRFDARSDLRTCLNRFTRNSCRSFRQHSELLIEATIVLRPIVGGDPAINELEPVDVPHIEMLAGRRHSDQQRPIDRQL